VNLEEFVSHIQTQRLPVGVVTGDQIVEGLSVSSGGWTAEKITAEAFHQDVLPVSVSWESGLSRVKAILERA